MYSNMNLLLVIVTVVLVLYLSTVNSNRDFKSRGSSSNGGLLDHEEEEEEDDFHHNFHHDDTLFHTVGLDHPDHLPPQGICEPIKIGLCMEVGYNQTTMPNLVGHDGQADADALLQTFTPLIQYGCSAHLKLFLCSAYVPMCTDKVPEPIGPCRSLCENVRQSCEPILKEFGFSWPPSLNCSKFHPENNHQHMCIPGPSEHDQYNMFTDGSFLNPSSSAGTRRNHHHSQSPSFSSSSIPHQIRNGMMTPTGINERPSVGLGIPGAGSGSGHSTSILQRRPIITPPITSGYVPPNINLDLPFPYSQHHFTNDKVNTILHKQQQQRQNTGQDIIKHKDKPQIHQQNQQCFGPRKVWSKGSCWVKCPTIDVTEHAIAVNSLLDDKMQSKGLTSLFQPSEILFARNYVLLWASLSLTTAFLALMLSICSPKLSTAEKPILYISLCQVLFSIGIIIGSTIPFSCFTDPMIETTTELLAGSGMNVPSLCAVVFLLTYFFGIAATLWWVILCLSWLLSISGRLSVSLEQKEWSIFHLVSWGIASILTSAALILKKVDADELTGLCGVGYQNIDALIYYNMIPINICLSFGFLFLLIGIILRHFTNQNHILCLDKLKPYHHQQQQQQLNSTSCDLHHYIHHQQQQQHNHNHHHHHHHNRSSMRGAPQGYTPVLISNSNSSSSYVNNHHCSRCNGVVSNGLQLQKIKAIQNSKAVWMRVGIFALVHSLPIACQVGTMAYELSGREAWESGRERPNIQIFLLRLNMNLIAGLTTGVWVLSTYSWKSLSSLTQRFCSCLILFANKRKNKNSTHKSTTNTSSAGGIGDVLNNGSAITNPTLLASTVPLVPSTNTNMQSVISSSAAVATFPSTQNTVLSTFQSQPQSINNNNININSSVRGGGHKKSLSSSRHYHHHNHPLPPIPPARNNNNNSNANSIDQLPPRTDAWRRGETIL